MQLQAFYPPQIACQGMVYCEGRLFDSYTPDQWVVIVPSGVKGVSLEYYVNAHWLLKYALVKKVPSSLESSQN
jgi:hypothetical protein